MSWCLLLLVGVLLLARAALLRFPLPGLDTVLTHR